MSADRTAHATIATSPLARRGTARPRRRVRAAILCTPTENPAAELAVNVKKRVARPTAIAQAIKNARATLALRCLATRPTATQSATTIA